MVSLGVCAEGFGVRVERRQAEPKSRSLGGRHSRQWAPLIIVGQKLAGKVGPDGSAQASGVGPWGAWI
jgi:hypothetical protein